ncbi:thioredoxin [Schlesneria paludicola]|uniref:thioredoxin n=1 Tax=Schlesneria paludicola TaxID=360056 RepID=UPI000299D669|nr:thioredoxin [Schlesneria paludicola]
MSASAYVINVTRETFEQEIIQKSMEVPVVVDFWAPWCNPCRQLAPILESLAEEMGGKFILAKVNTDEQPEIAQAFRVESLPTVFGMVQGQPVDQFTGLLSAEQIREWLARLLPSPAQQLAQEGMKLAETDPKAAELKYRQALELMPDEDGLKILLAGVILKQGRLDECATILEALEQRGFLEPEAERLKSELDVRRTAAESGGVEEARKVAEADPTNLIAQIHLAEAYAASQQHRKALEICLEIVQKDFGEARAEAKSTMVKIFDMLGPGSELTSEYRRKLATALY